MRGKRSKQYRKLMQQYGLSFGFRNPYQVLLDADIIRDADKFKMDLIGGLERTLHGEVKPMITQCCMRHLYAASSEPGVSYLIDKAKLYERRRCGHLPTEYPEPLSAKECIASVVDPKGSGTNKHRYVVASQELEVRKAMRKVKGVPLVYISRSIMIMEPMADVTAGVREREERAKFRDGLKSSGGRESGSQGMKRKRDDGEEDGDRAAATEKKKKAKYGKGVKGPNPLAVKKPKKKVEDEGTAAKQLKQPKTSKDENTSGAQESDLADGQENEASDPNTKKKRKRKHKSAKEGAVGTVADADTEVQSAGE